MDLHPVKQKIIAENVLKDYDVERELLNSTPYELVIINFTKEDLVATFPLMPVAIINVRIPITEELVSQMPPSIKIISHLGVGFEKIDVKACRQRNIEVSYTPDYGTITVADHTVGLLFAAQRRLLNFHKSIVDKRQWTCRVAGTLRNLNTMTLGVIGCGRIGTCFADKMRPFVKEILTHNSKDPTTNSLKEIFERSDIISLHIPHSSANHHLISSETISQMKRQPILINVSRGGLVDTKALIQALKSGQISYAALDVLENEPNIDEELIQLDNVLITPHAAWLSIESERLLRETGIQNILQVLKGEKPLYPIPQ